jgi:hypothetical protein
MTAGSISLQKGKRSVRAGIRVLLRLCARCAISCRRLLSIGSFLSDSERPLPESPPQVLGIPHFKKTHHRDRAAVLMTGVFQILETAPAQERHQAVENYLRDELSDVVRQALADREPPDA